VTDVSLPSSARLRRILLAYTVNKLGTWFGYVALVVVVYDHTKSALAVAGLLVASNLIPALLSPAVVARVEASRRQSGLTVLYFLEAATAIILAFLLWNFWLPAILPLAAIDGTAALAANALLRATAAHVAVEDSGQADHLRNTDQASETAQREANAALNVAWTATFALGPAIGGLVVAAAGGPTALLIDAGTFFICGVLLLDLRPRTEEIEDASVRARLASAWSHLRSVRELRRVLVTEAVAIVFFASAPPVEVLYAKGTLHSGDSGYGLLLGVWGVGTVLGSLIFARWVRRSLTPLLIAGTLAVGVAYLGWAAAPTLALACLAGVIGGLGNGMQWAAVISMVQKLTPPGLHGRLMSATESMGALCPALGYVLGGTVAALSSPRAVFLIAGSASVIATVVFLRIFRSGLRGMELNQEAESSKTTADNPIDWSGVVVASTGTSEIVGTPSE